MTTTRRIIRALGPFICLGFGVLLFAGCGGGGGGDNGTLPPTAPVSGVVGIAQDGPLVNATVSVYEFGTGSRGALLASGTTDSQGGFSLAINAPTQPVLIEITGGSYVEEASGLSVSLTPTQVLQAVSLYTLGSAVHAQVTFYTHLAAGLAQYYLAHGQSVQSAILNANNEVSAVAGLPVLATRPLLITDIANASVALTPSLQYGFLTAGISQWTLDASIGNNTPVHSIHNSIAFAQRAFDDISYDGVMDGVGSAGILSVGTIPLNADVYRHGLARATLALVQSPRNQTALKTATLLPPIKLYNDSVSALFGGRAVIPIDQEGTSTTNFLPMAGSAVNGVPTVSATVSDVVGLTAVALQIDGITQGTLLNTSAPSWTINTGLFADGVHAVTIASTNLLGHVSNTSQTLIFDNTAPVITATSISGSVSSASGGSCTVSGTVSDATSGIASMTVNGVPVSFAGGRWAYTVGISTSPQYMTASTVDLAGNVFQKSIHVFTAPPVIGLGWTVACTL